MKIRNIYFVLVLFLNFFLVELTMAVAKPKYILDGVDLAPAVNFYRMMIHPLKQKVTVYHWNSDGEGRGDGPEVLDIIKENSLAFWKMHGNPKTTVGGMYGVGLYTAIDPEVTQSYGNNGSGGWFLLELELPMGFRLLDLFAEVSNHSLFQSLGKSLSKEMLDIQEHFKCPDLSDVEKLFNEGGWKLNSQCSQLVQMIFKDILKIDGFSYGYGQTNYTICNSNPMAGQRAIVITNNEWITSKNAFYYTKHSTHFLENRRRIQTLFYKSLDTKFQFSDLGKSLFVEYLKNHESMKVSGLNSICGQSTCEIKIRFCDEKESCEDLLVDTLPIPSGPLFSTETAKKTAPHELLWRDLDGKPKTPNISVWMKNKLFGCSGKLPYGSDVIEQGEL